MKILAIALTLVMMLPFAYADLQSSEYEISDESVLVSHKIAVANFSSEIIFLIPKDALAVSLDSGSAKLAYDILQEKTAKKVVVKPNDEIEEFGLSYTTKSLLEKPRSTFFVAETRAALDSDLSIKVILPEKAALAEPIINNQGSIYPKPSKVESDGKRIMFYWEQKNMNEGSSFPILIEYSESSSELSGLWILALFILISLAAVFFVFKRKGIKKSEKSEIQEQKAEKPEIEKKLPDMELHLKEDEKAVVNVLKLKGGSTTQSTLRIATGLSKATLSRILMELEQRNIILKEKKGNKNLVILKSSVWNNLEQE